MFLAFLLAVSVTATATGFDGPESAYWDAPSRSWYVSNVVGKEDEKDGPNTPAATVRAFYAFHVAHDMAFTPESVRAKADWLAPDLLSLCEKYFARPTSPDEAPPINGDPFTDSQEYPKRFRVGAARVSGEAAWVPVRLEWSRGQPRSVTAHLVRIARRWRIWDVRFTDGSSLRNLLEE